MKVFEFSERTTPECFIEAVLRDFIPELERISEKRRLSAFGDNDPGREENIKSFVLRLDKLRVISALRAPSEGNDRAVAVRIEMRTLDDVCVWFRFVPLGASGEPLLPEKKNLIFLVFPRLADIEWFRKEGYDFIATSSPIKIQKN